MKKRYFLFFIAAGVFAWPFSLCASDVDLSPQAATQTTKTSLKRPYGFSWQLGAFRSTDGFLTSLMRDLGFVDYEARPLLQQRVTGWYGITSNIRIGGFIQTDYQSHDEPFAPDPNLSHQIDITRRGGGFVLDAIWQKKRLTVGGGMYLGWMATYFKLSRLAANESLNFDDLLNSIATQDSTASWTRTLSGFGPYLQGHFLTEILITRWLALGLQAGWSFHVVPKRFWLDLVSKQALTGAPRYVFQGWDVGLSLIFGRLQPKSLR